MDTTAVLYRTRKAGRVIEEALVEAQIKYYVIGGSSYWQSPEVRYLVSFVGLTQYPSDHLLGTAIRSPFWPTKYLPKSAMAGRLKELKTDEHGYWHFLAKEPHQVVDQKNIKAVSEFVQFVHGLQRYRNLRAAEAVRQVMATLRAVDHYSSEELSPDSDPVANLSELVKIAERFETVKEFLDYTRRVTAASKRKAGVALSTIHSAKGLQFTRVHLISCNDGILPHAKSDDLEGERNTYFVGISRAERELTVTYSGQPSPFLQTVREMEGKSNEA